MRTSCIRIFTFLFICIQVSAFSQTRLNPLTIDYLKESLDYDDTAKVKNRLISFQVSDQIYAFYVNQNDVPSP